MFPVKRQSPFRTFVRALIGPVILGAGILIVLNAFSRTVVAWAIAATILLVLVWWALG